MQPDTQDSGGIGAFQNLVLDTVDERHSELVRKNHEISNLFKDDLPDDVAQAGSIEGVGNAAEVKVDFWRRKEVNLWGTKQLN